MINASATAISHRADDNGKRLVLGKLTNEVDVLEDGGNVVITRFVEAATPLDKLSVEPGLNEQVAPAIGK